MSWKAVLRWCVGLDGRPVRRWVFFKLFREELAEFGEVLWKAPHTVIVPISPDSSSTLGPERSMPDERN